MMRSGIVRRRSGVLSFLCVLVVGAVSSSAASPVQTSQAANPSLLSIDAPRNTAKDPLPAIDAGPRTASGPLAQGPIVRPSFNIDPSLNAEVEPNGTTATATPLPLVNGATHIVGNIWPAADVDFYSFTAAAGDRVYAAIQAQTSASGSADSVLELYASDGTTILEGDEDDGSFGGLSSSIAGTTIPAAGTYYVRVRHSSAANTLRPYHLYFQLRSGTPTAETEPNDTFPGQALPAGGWASGQISTGTDVDFYSLNLNAGDTVFLSLDQDPERNGDANLQLGLGPFDTQILVVNDSGAGFAPYTAPDSEAFFMTVKDAGTYGVFVGMPTGGVAGTYHLSVSVFPRVTTGVNCTTYTSTDVPKAVPDVGMVQSTLTVPGHPRIADLNVAIQGTHTFMADLDVHLISPAGNDNGLFSDVFNQTTGSARTTLDVVFDDEAAIAPAFQNSVGVRLQPEFNYRLAWYDGEDAGGTWTLAVRDDATGDTGSITGWSIEVCEAPPPPACAPGFVQQTVYATDFESGAAGFTHSGTLDEWELGLPATVATTTANPLAAFNSCASGTNCWKTDLDGAYEPLSNQDLLSPNINLAGLSPPVVVNWSQRYQMDTANNDHYSVSIQPVGVPASAVRLFEHLDTTMAESIGQPPTTVGQSAGWGVVSRRADALAGSNAELVFHLDSNTGATNFGGAAIDDVRVTACRAASADLAITKTDGVTTATPGGSVTYTITASNAGPDATTGVTVADTFPAVETCTWTCVGAGGGTCTASGAGNVNDATVNLPAGGSVTYTASCAINASATGTLTNTATVASSLTDPSPANNSATDTDTLAAQADIAITKTDGVATATPGGSVTYTITSSNAGPSNAPGATVADTFPASLTCNWTCAGAGGGTCTASGTGNISDTVNLPAGGSVTHTATCAVSASATGTLSNTATATAPAGVTDPSPGNNSATDTDTLVAQADLAITKTDGVTSVAAGGTTTYTITTSNAGPSNAPGATVADTFPASLTCNWTCTGAGGGTCTASGTGNIGDTVNLPAGGSVTHMATCAVSASATGTLTNTATATAPAGVTDPSPGNNSATDTDTLVAQADLAITKTDGVTSVAAGGTTTYTITASNAGPSNAPGATVADTFPASLTCNWTCTGAGGGTCAASGTGNIGGTVNLPSGGSVTYTAACNVALAATGTLTNTATVAAPGGVTDPTPGNNSATDSDTITAAGANLAASKTVTGTFTPGSAVTYTVVLVNSGGAQADNAGDEFTDVLPAGLTLGSATASSGTATTVGNTVHWNGAIPIGGTVTITITATIQPSATGAISNQGTVSYDSDANGTNDASRQTDDPAVGGATDPTSFTVGGAIAELSITKTDGVTSATPGGSTTYTISASNAGPSDAIGATVADTFPASLTCNWTCTNAGGGTCTASGTGNIGDTVNLPAGGSVTYTAVCAIDATATGTLANTATVAVPAGANDPAPGNNSATDTDTLDAQADLSITKTDNTGNVLAGGTLTYVVAATNAGPSAATGANVSDTLPASCLSASWTCAGTGGATCTASGSGSLAETVNLPVGGTVTFNVVCPVAPGTADGTVITNTATVAAPAGTTDPTPGNNSATDTTTVNVGAGLTATKTVVAGTRPGDAVTYTVTINNGPGPQADNPGDEMTDVLPASLTLVSASATSGTAVANVGTNTVTWNGAIPANGSVTVTIVATIDPGAAGPVANQATVSFDADANGSNESTGLSDDPAVGGAADPTVFTVNGVITATTPVPALGGWALLLAMLGLTGLAWRSRRTA